MTGCRVYFIVDNTYARELVGELVKLFNDKGVLSGKVSCKAYRQALNACDPRIGDAIRLVLQDHGYSRVVILVDTEGADPQEVSGHLLEKHVEPLGEYSLRVRVYPVHPCLE